MRYQSLALFIVVLLAATTASGEITLKKTFFGGWQYSTDGAEFHRVGFSGSDLKQELSGNDSALTYMNKYRDYNATAMMFAIPAGFLIGWPVGSSIGGSEWEDRHTTMLIIGSSLLVLSFLFEAEAGSNLKKAVANYNEYGTRIGLKVGFGKSRRFGSTTPWVGITARF